MRAYFTPGYHGPRWTPEQLALLGTADNATIAAQIGRTVDAVRLMRTRLGIAKPIDRRRRRPESLFQKS
jgi:hypothetical protein